MITAIIYSIHSDINSINGFEVHGHADYAKPNEADIVCVAVSAIAQTAYLGLDLRQLETLNHALLD